MSKKPLVKVDTISIGIIPESFFDGSFEILELVNHLNSNFLIRWAEFQNFLPHQFLLIWIRRNAVELTKRCWNYLKRTTDSHHKFFNTGQKARKPKLKSDATSNKGIDKQFSPYSTHLRRETRISRLHLCKLNHFETVGKP